MSKPPDLLQGGLKARVSLLSTTLRASTIKQYSHTVRMFIDYLDEFFPEVRRPDQLRRDPHMLGWFQSLWVGDGNYSGKPRSSSTRGGCLIRMRKLLDLLADHDFPPHPGLILSQDIPRPDQTLPRPLTPEDDARLLAELSRRNDLFSNALLLTRLTGMRLGETADLAVDCLRHVGDDQWAIHVPVGKLHNDRLVPVDEQARDVIARLQFFRTLPGPEGIPPEPNFLIPRPHGPVALCTRLRVYLRNAAHQAGIAAHVVPHQMRHTYATSLLRAGISMPGLMKLLGHRSANMTLRYVEVTQKDLQREFYLARQQPRHQIPLPASATVPEPDFADAATVIQRITAAARLLDLYRQKNGSPDNNSSFLLLVRRLGKVRSRFQKLASGSKN